MTEPRRRLLDSYAILALLGGEDGAETVAELLRSAQRDALPLLMNDINVGEVYYIVAKERSPEAAERVLDHLETLPLEVVGNTLDEVLEAARIKAAHPLSYADAFAVATAIRFDATLVTGDRELEAVTERVQVEWI